MRIVQIISSDDGSHKIEELEEGAAIPEGWALIPNGMSLPNTAPYFDIVVSEGMVVRITPSKVPAPISEQEPSTEYISYTEIAEAVREGVNSI